MWMRSIKALKYLIVALALILSLGGGVSSAPAKPPMPVMENPVPILEELGTFCEGQIEASFEYWWDVETQGAGFFKYLVVRLPGDDRTAFLVIVQDPNSTSIKFTVYIDYDGDGLVDRQTSSQINGCDEIKKVIAERSKKRT